MLWLIIIVMALVSAACLIAFARTTNGKEILGSRSLGLFFSGYHAYDRDHDHDPRRPEHRSKRK